MEIVIGTGKYFSCGCLQVTKIKVVNFEKHCFFRCGRSFRRKGTALSKIREAKVRQQTILSSPQSVLHFIFSSNLGIATIRLLKMLSI